MKKERIEFTILRYLGRPPGLFDDTAVVAVREIISAAGDKFDWGLFTEYAVFHKLSQTLYPNMREYNKFVSAQVRKCESSREEELATKGHKGHKEGYTCGAQEEDLATKGHKGHKGEIYTCGASQEDGLATKEHKGHKEEDGAREIPEFVISKFRGIFLANVSRNEFLAKELVKVNQLLEENGVEVLNWKGPTLALQAYGDLALRQFQDIDTLVKHEDLEKAKAILLENGFEDITPQNRNPEYSAGRGYEFFNTKKRYELELEYSIFLARSVLDYDYDGMFERASSTSFGNEQIKTLSIEDNLLFTSFHGTKHLWFRLRWFADILGKFELNKDEILSTIDDFEQKQLIAFCIYIAYKEFNLEGSANFTNLHELLLKYNIHNLKHFNKIIHSRILQHNTLDSLVNHHQKAKMIAELVEGSENKKKYSNDIKYFNLWRRTKTKISPSQADYDLIKLPKPLYPLYFIVRAVRIMIRKLT